MGRDDISEIASLAGQFAKLIEADGRSKVAIADAAGIHATHLSHYLAGTPGRGLSADAARRLAAALGHELSVEVELRPKKPRKQAAGRL